MPKDDWGGRIRWDVHVRDGCRCVYCDLDMATLKRWDLFTNDHLVPKKKSGPYERQNLVTACLGCNQLKGSFDPTNNGTDTLTVESRGRLIQRAKDHIEAKRRMWDSDFQEILSEAARRRSLSSESQ